MSDKRSEHSGIGALLRGTLAGFEFEINLKGVSKRGAA